MDLSWPLGGEFIALIGELLALGLAYALAVGPLRERIAPGKPFPKRHAIFFYSALVVFYLTEGSPLHPLADSYSFAAHMFQHVVLVFALPPLLIAGMPAWLLRPLMLNRVVKPVVRVLTQPVVALLVFNIVFSVWHVPLLYEGMLSSETVHHLEHLMFIFTALMMWWPVLSPLPELPRLGYGWQLVYLTLDRILQVPVSIALLFTNKAYYPTYIATSSISGINPLSDQQLGSGIMTAAGIVVLGTFFIVACFKWYQQENQPDADAQPLTEWEYWPPQAPQREAPR
jgi:putative membrane protein